jgi:glutathione S-transferase
MQLPILYSFRRCPYAIRARLALAYAEISYELREVSLKNKPQQMLDISAKGTTPVLQIFEQDSLNSLNSLNFIVLEESLDIMNWAIAQNDHLNWQDLADQSLEISEYLIGLNDRQFKQALDRYKYANRFPESAEFYRQQGEEFLRILENQLQNYGFLIGDRQTNVDFAIFPFVRQFAYVDIDWFRSSPYQHLQQWLTWHETSSIFDLVMQKYSTWNTENQIVIISDQPYSSNPLSIKD